MSAILYDETIAAIATAPGEGGIGIVRISGNESLQILKKTFDNADRLSPNHLTYGHIVDNSTGETIDEVMAVYMKAPHSYTAEDVCEIQCHGSVVSLRKILALTIRNGARIAEPGEFTKRAFLNGRLDLSQAEAVIDLIKAKSDTTFDVALNQLEGGFSDKIRELRKYLTDILVSVTVNIDYPDEDIELVTYEKLAADLCNIKEMLEEMLNTADTGRIIREGLNVAIIGKPNVGKSSLMNALLKETRAIVTAIPGTTRDTIEEMVSIRNIPVKLTDTAGIRETEDIIEKIGIEKSRQSFNDADLVIFMMDNSRKPDKEDYEIINAIGSRKAICLLNKSDLGACMEDTEIRKLLPACVIIETSMKNETGLSQIEDVIESMVYSGEVKHNSSLIVTNVRHQSLLEEALHSVEDAIEGTEAGQALELVEIDINRAYECLGLIIGEEVEDDIINEVFKRFCLGK